MSNVKVGDEIEILSIVGFNRGFVNVGDVAKVIEINSKYISFGKDGWDFTQHSRLSWEGVRWRIVPPTVEPPTINSEPFITIKGVEVGSSLERALNLVVLYCKGEDIVDGNGLIVSCSSAINIASHYLCDIVSDLNVNGLDWYILKSEEEAKLNKEVLDKEIKELEDKLQELKTKRGEYYEAP